jgi:hypothetical protein
MTTRATALLLAGALVGNSALGRAAPTGPARLCNRLVRASTYGPAPRPPGRTRGARWITIPPPLPARGRRQVDLYAAARWIMETALLKR